MNTSLEIIQRISHKLQQLVKERDALQREKDKLLQELSERQAMQDTLHQELSLLEDQVSILKTATFESDDQSKKEFEKKISHFIKDIDKVIAHLQS